MTKILYATKTNERKGANTSLGGTVVQEIELYAVLNACNGFLNNCPYAEETFGRIGGQWVQGPEADLSDLTEQDLQRYDPEFRKITFEEFSKEFPEVDLDPKACYLLSSASMGSEILEEKVRDLNDSEIQVIDAMMKKIFFYRVAMKKEYE